MTHSHTLSYTNVRTHTNHLCTPQTARPARKLPKHAVVRQAEHGPGPIVPAPAESAEWSEQIRTRNCCRGHSGHGRNTAGMGFLCVSASVSLSQFTRSRHFESFARRPKSVCTTGRRDGRVASNAYAGNALGRVRFRSPSAELPPTSTKRVSATGVDFENWLRT